MLTDLCIGVHRRPRRQVGLPPVTKHQAVGGDLAHPNQRTHRWRCLARRPNRLTLYGNAAGKKRREIAADCRAVTDSITSSRFKPYAKMLALTLDALDVDQFATSQALTSNVFDSLIFERWGEKKQKDWSKYLPDSNGKRAAHHAPRHVQPPCHGTHGQRVAVFAPQCHPGSDGGGIAASVP